jgi:iron only hydrogenase large subunit-like protein
MSIKLADLDSDFISPSQACILPPKRIPTESQEYSVVLDKPVEINLTDCLACSGCITSAETVLIAQQSIELFYQKLQEKSQKIIISISEQTRASFASKYNLHPQIVHSKLCSFFTALGVDFVFDASFARDLSLYANAVEFVSRYHSKQIPMLASSCPGWICYAEKTHDFVLPFLSPICSEQQIMGHLVKYYLPMQLQQNWKPNEIFHVSVMPCFDKKLEASRSVFTRNGIRDVDCVLASTEIEQILSRENINLLDIPETPLSPLYTKMNQNFLCATEGSSSGGYLSYILRFAAHALFNIQLSISDVENSTNGVEIQLKQSRNKTSDFKHVFLKDVNTNQILLRFSYV